MRVGRHRRFTANHTFHLDWRGRRLFVKVSPNHREAAEEIEGHARLRGLYPVPALLGKRRIGRYSVHVYQRHGHDAPDTGLLLDEINAADTGDFAELDATLTRVIEHYRAVISATLRRIRQGDTVTKLYGRRVRPGGRLDAYYGDDRPLLTLPDGKWLCPSQLPRTTLIVNGRAPRLDFPALARWLRWSFAAAEPVWAAATQGDPTDVNIGVEPVWFDYDTGGLNALAGEFACFLWYQRLHGGWLAPTYNPAAFVDHPATLAGRDRNRPAVLIQRAGRDTIEIAYQHQASPARRHVMARYLEELVYPLASILGVTDLVGWLRPYLVLRILGVYNVSRLTVSDAALSLAYLAEALDPEARLEALLGLPTCVNAVEGESPSPAP